MSFTSTIDETTIQQWMAAKLEPRVIEEELISRGIDAAVISTHLKRYRQLRNAGRRFNGFIFLAVGAFLGFVSCVLALTNPFPQLFDLFLYGITSLAVLSICIGLYFLLE